MRAPAGKTVVGAPAGKTVVGAPAGKTVVGAPAGKTVVGAPAGATLVGAPAGATLVGAPAGATLVGAPAGATIPHGRWATLDSTQALEQFLAGIERRALRIAEYATGNREDALDIVQEAMLKLAERYSSRPATEWPPLFHSILVSRIRDFQRRSKVRNRFRVWLRGRAEEGEEQPDPIASRPDPAAAPPERVIAGERGVERLERGIAALPDRQREAFVLRVWEGLDVAQTARAMGCSEGSVKTHLSRAMHTLRDCLEDHLP